MEWLSTEKSASIRKNLRKNFPNTKFSVRNDNYQVLRITVVESKDFDITPLFTRKPENNSWGTSYMIDVSTMDSLQVGPLFDETPLGRNLGRISELANEGNHNYSDFDTDYFDVGWYVNITVNNPTSN